MKRLPPDRGSARPPGLLSRLVDGIGSVPFGVTMMVLVLLYCWIGSAGTAPFSNWFVRQSFEMTEMEWFSWWPFVLLLLLMCLSLTIGTIRNIRLNLPNLGVWVTHAGILILTLGCLVYFGLKLEGDALVFRRAAVMQAGSGAPVSMTLQPGAETVVRRDDERFYRVRVADLNPSYELLTGEDAGKTTYAAQLMIQPFDGDREGRPFIRQLLAGYPEYAEDVVPGQGRAIKVAGKRLLDDDLRVELQYEPATRIHLQHRPAIHVRAVESDEWSEATLRGLPRYHEFVDSPADVMLAGDDGPYRFRPLDLAPRWKQDDRPFGDDVSVRVTGYLPFARPEEHWQPGGDQFRPLMRFSLRLGEITAGGDLVANMAHPHHVPIGNQFLDASLRWIEDAAELEREIRPAPASLTVRVPGRGVTRSVPLTEAAGGPVPIRGTGYSVQVVDSYPHWSIAGPGGGKSEASMVLVRVTRGETAFMRAVVTPQAELSQDLDEKGHRQGRLIDDRIEMELESYRPPGLTLVAGPLGLHALAIGRSGEVTHLPATLGRAVVFPGDGMEVLIEAVSETSRLVERPRLIPRAQRDAKAGTSQSLVRVEVSEPSGTHVTWVRYSHYAHPSRAGYFPKRVALADGRTLELVYSRETLPLPDPVALETFVLETYPGGRRERDFISLVRFQQDGAWSDLREIRSNQPTEYRGWWFFQSTWDPPDEQRSYAGMNYTGLGVGNRRGVAIMLAGSIMTVLGTFWAFYIKPLLLRRRLDRQPELRETEDERSTLERHLPAAAGSAAMSGVGSEK
ncbi:MAG: hypothetical protein OEQ13_04125 [Acidobacteriota bacterium]|nr:hypothetical protein [Acidobacteriota bacterium]